MTDISGTLPLLNSINRREENFEDVFIDGEYDGINFSNAKGKKLIIKGPSTNFLDLSGSIISAVILEGNFKSVDLSRARIEKLYTDKAKIILITDEEAKIGLNFNDP